MSRCITTMHRLLALAMILGLIPAATVNAYIPELYDPRKPGSNPGEIYQNQIIVRFVPGVAARMHAERIGKGLGINDAAANTAAPDVEPFDPATVAGLTPSMTAAHRAEKLVARDPAVKAALLKSGLADKAAFEKAAKAIEIEAAKSTFGPIGLYTIDLAPGKDPVLACREMLQRSDVVYAEPKRVYRTFATPNDANYFLQWSLERIGVPEAWDYVDMVPLRTNPDRIGVIVIDSGVRLTHKDIASVASIDRAVDVFPFNGDAYAQNDPNLYDANGHGTAVAGIAMALRNNASASTYPGGGIAGIASNGNATDPGFDLYTVNCEDGNFVQNWWEGVYWFEDSGASVVNMSFGSYGGSPMRIEVDAMRTLAQANMLAFVSSGNNDGNADITFPAAFSTAVSVGGIDSEDLRVSRPKWWYGSNYGETLDIMGVSQTDRFWAGDGVIVLNGNYSILTIGNLSDTGFLPEMNGTSAAAPHLTGVAAAMKYVNPDLNSAQIRNILYRTAQDQIGDPIEDIPGKDIYYGHGLVNAFAAVQLAYATEGFGSESGGDDPYEFVGTYVNDDGTTSPIPNNTAQNARESEDLLGRWMTEYLGPGISWDRDWYTIPVFEVDSTVRIEVFHHRADGRVRVSLHHPFTGNTLAYVEEDEDYAYIDRKVPTSGNFGIKVDGSLLGAGYDLRITVYPPGEVPPNPAPPETDPLADFGLIARDTAVEAARWSFYP